MKLIAFTARCQRYSIYPQLAQGVRCFDLRVRFSKTGSMMLVHGPVEYVVSKGFYRYDFWQNLDDFNKLGCVYVRVILDVRHKRNLTELQRDCFVTFCKDLEEMYHNISFWGGQVLCDWHNPVYYFKSNPTCEERYGSVTKPKWLWGWWPWLYASRHNHENREKGTDKEILLIDYIDIK